jgi:transcriptional regulator with XRE-family HTH domain
MDALSKEFMQMVKDSGWTQREVARQLELTEGAVSHVMKGRNKASPTVVRLFRLILESVKGGSAVKIPAKKAETWEEELLRKLRPLKPGQRKRVLAAVEAMIGAVRG